MAGKKTKKQPVSSKCGNDYSSRRKSKKMHFRGNKFKIPQNCQVESFTSRKRAVLKIKGLEEGKRLELPIYMGTLKAAEK
jgi:hypothetical protein